MKNDFFYILFLMFIKKVVWSEIKKDFFLNSEQKERYNEREIDLAFGKAFLSGGFSGYYLLFIENNCCLRLALDGTIEKLNAV